MTFSVYLIPLFRGKIISARGTGREEDRDAGARAIRWRGKGKGRSRKSVGSGVHDIHGMSPAELRCR